MAPFGAEKHVFRWYPQLGKWNMDSFWMLSGFFGPPEWFLEVSEAFKIFNLKFWKKIQVTLCTYGGQLRHFLNGFVIFLSIPSCGHCKFTKLPVFFTEFLVKNFESFWHFKKSFWWPKKPWNHPKTRFPQSTRPPKNMFFCPKRGHICQIDQIGKGRETL